jgi:hypothetical protein
MNVFIDKLLNNQLVESKEVLDQYLNDLVDQKLDQIKLRLASEMFETSNISEAVRNVMKIGRTKTFRVRIRKGKIQRRKKLSAVKGWTIRGGKMTRMSPIERRNRKMGARRSKTKRRAKLGQSLRKRIMSLRKRRAMGL